MSRSKLFLGGQFVVQAEIDLQSFLILSEISPDGIASKMNGRML